MSDFERREEGVLDRFSDEELVEYVVAAREAGESESAKRAVGILTYRLQPLVEGRVAARVPAGAREDVVMAALESFVRSAFDGKVIRSAKAFIATITKRRIADFHRDRERHPDQMPLAGEHFGEEGTWGEEESVEDETEAIAVRDAIERVLARRNEMHRRVIMFYGPEQMGGEDLSGEETIERMRTDHGETVSVANVQQIWRRFKVDLAEELAAGEDGGTADG